eukprot:1348875-Amorphochlora_amoeboformis.AAC.1
MVEGSLSPTTRIPLVYPSSAPAVQPSASPVLQECMVITAPGGGGAVSYTHLRAHETDQYL